MKLAHGTCILFALSTLLSGCSVGGNVSGGAYGLSPILNYADVQASTQNYSLVRDAFIIRAGYAPGGAVDWYEVTRAGFDYIDEQCSAYLSALYQVRRDRDAATRQLQSLDGATRAILGVAQAGSNAILITAAAFGLATQSVDNATSSLLFAMDPTDIQALLRNQSNAYRIGVSSQAASYRTSTAAMEAIRGYLSLCLPVSIEAQVKAALQGTQYVATPTNYGVPNLNRVQTGTVNVATTAPTTSQIANTPTPQPPKPAADQLAKGLTAQDIAIRTSELMVLQKNLCVTADGDIGGPGSQTREAIKLVQLHASTMPTGLLDDKAKLAISGMTVCDPTIHRTPYEHIVLADAAGVTGIKADLKAFVESNATLFGDDIKALVAKPDFITGGTLSADNRAVISAIQGTVPGMNRDGNLTLALHDRLG